MDVGVQELLPTTTMVDLAKVAVTETEITTITTTIIMKWTMMVGPTKTFLTISYNRRDACPLGKVSQ